MTAALTLGAPGVYRAPARVDRSYRGVRLDVLGAVGIAPRGPVGTAVRVESWSEYQRLFGGFEGRGRLPYSVAAFFDQGGERAYIVRIAPQSERNPPDEAIPATAIFCDSGTDDGIRLAAANEGAWGNALRISLDFDIASRFDQDDPDDVRAPDRRAATVVLPDGLYIYVGAVVRVSTANPASHAFRRVTDVVEEYVGIRRRRVAVLDRAIPALTTAAPRRSTIAVIEGRMTITDRDQRLARAEELGGLGLDPAHPRWLMRVLREQSLLVTPIDPSPLRTIEPPGAQLPSVSFLLAQRGRDRNDAVGGDDFFDASWDPRADEKDHYGVHALLAVPEVGLVVAPDLLVDPTPTLMPAEPEAPPPRDSCFHPCPPRRRRCGPSMATTTSTEEELDDDPTANRPVLPLYDLVETRTREGLETWTDRQRRLVEIAERPEVQSFVVMLDVPPGLDIRAATDWRASFDSSFAAAYHPWLGVARDDDERTDAVFVPPSAFAAGIVAARERRLGLPWGPANDVAVGAVALRDQVSSDLHDRLHSIGINAFVVEPDGVRLMGARTLSRNPQYRQLSVRRTMLTIRLTILRDSQWMAFETNNEALWSLVRFHLIDFLRQLDRGGAFAGRTEAESFFVRCDAGLNPQASRDVGRLLVEVGVAPAEPMEFIVLRVERNGDGDVRMEERRG